MTSAACPLPMAGSASPYAGRSLSAERAGRGVWPPSPPALRPSCRAPSIVTTSATDRLHVCAHFATYHLQEPIFLRLGLPCKASMTSPDGCYRSDRRATKPYPRRSGAAATAAPTHACAPSYACVVEESVISNLGHVPGETGLGSPDDRHRRWRSRGGARMPRGGGQVGEATPSSSGMTTSLIMSSISSVGSATASAQ
jgi:hypothetical protein